MLFFVLLMVWGSIALDPTIVPLTEYVANGAVCLDGSTPAYYYRPGNGSGRILQSIRIILNVAI